MPDLERSLIEQGRVKCLCGRKATGTTEYGEPECADLSCHAASAVERMRQQLAGAVEALERIAAWPVGRAYPSHEIIEYAAEEVARLTTGGGQSDGA